MKNRRCTRNEKTRGYIDELLKGCKPGTVIFSDEISVALSTKFRSVTRKNVGLALREREDVRNNGMGIWVKI